MNPPSAESPDAIRLANRTKTFWRELAGFTSLICILFAVVGILLEERLALFALVIPPVMFVLCAWLDSMAPEIYAILRANRMVLPEGAGQQRTIEWADVQRVRWAKRRNQAPPIRIDTCRPGDGRARPVRIGLDCLSAEDGIALIRYIRTAAAEVEQENWPTFCRLHTVPLIDRARAEKRAADDLANDRSLAGRFARAIRRHPFLAGFAAPVLYVSRKTWWSLAAIVAVSALVNIRLAWGAWISPATEISAAFVGTTFCFGAVARSPRRTSDRGEPRTNGIFLWFAAVLIASPLAGNAAALGWIPRQLGRLGVRAGLLMLFAPIAVCVWREHRKRTQRKNEPQADVLRRWEHFERTGELPER